jgi:predicted RNA-binding Zn ribbon-like protein
MRISSHEFKASDLVGGDVVVDLVNTVTARNAVAADWLDGYPRLLDWAALTRRFEEGVLAELGRLDAEQRDGAAALERIRDLRESVHALVVAAIAGREPPRDALSRFESHWREAVAAAHVSLAGGRAQLALDVEASGLDYIRHELALRAFRLLEELPLDRTRVCAGAVCGWLFIDRSKAGRRRWCDMATCGNAAKSKRHYERTRAAARRSFG